MAAYSISVTIDETSIQVKPDTLSMTTNDDVSWTGTNARKFSIVFEDEAVFGRREIAHDQAGRPQRTTHKGRHKYSVVASDSGLVLDPVIIVGDPPTGPTPP